VIRKVILFLIIVLVTLWFFGAHLVKNKLLAAAHELESDNIKISHQGTKISGFPFFWQVEFLSPKISFVDQKSIKEVSLLKFQVKTDYLIQNINFDLGKEIQYSDMNISEDKIEYDFVSNKDMKIDLFLQSSLYLHEFESVWKNIASLAKCDFGTVAVNSGGSKLFDFSDIQALAESKQINAVSHLNLKLTGDYDSDNEYAKVKKAHLLVDLSYLVNNPLLSIEDHPVDFERKLEFAKFHLKLDDASLGIQGDLCLSRSSLPRGDFDVSLVKYQDVISKIVPEDSIISQSYIKQAVSKAAVAELGPNVQNIGFKIFFSNKGISIEQVKAL
jgi:hypothetical protein